ncbi:MAG: DUF6516 family protein [bacterium]
MISLLESYSEIIASYEVRRYRQYGGAYVFVAIIQFTDRSELHVRDYLFLNVERKYSFHWQDAQEQLISRWDNAEHHKHIETFPFHLHIPKGLKESRPMTLDKVLEHIKNQITEV